MSKKDEKFPAEAYKKNVLAECFADAKEYFFDEYQQVDLAYAVMLGEQGIITTDERAAILRALTTLDFEALKAADYDGTFEDFFYLRQREILANCDPDIAGKLHTGRSRNDIDVTIYRLRLRKEILPLIDSAIDLKSVLLDLAGRHIETLMPAYTHTQPAQPTTLAHFLLAMAENIGRDIRRLQRAFENMNFCPLGSGAITTSGFAISRHRLAELLGFTGPTVNSYGSIASVDYFTEALGAVAALLVNVGKFAQEFLLMAMVEFGVIRLPDGYVQGSSIMPQKRNPVALEHIRAIGSKALGQALSVFTAVHNTPFGDINDVEDDLQPLIYRAVRDANRAVNLFSNTLRSAEFDIEKLRKKAGEDFITVTELADTIVRKEGLSFQIAHRLVGNAVKSAIAAGSNITPEILRREAESVLNRPLRLTDAEIEEAISPDNFVNVRKIFGGPAPVETQRALSVEFQRNDEVREWFRSTQKFLETGAQKLENAVKESLNM